LTESVDKMAKFMLKCMTLLVVLFFGVLLGMQQASEGINEMKGTATDDYKGAFQIQEADNGNYQAAVLGETITSHDLAEKQDKLENIKAFNIFSEIAGKLSDLISVIFQTGITITMTVFQQILNTVFS
jgi:hypothetical protein